MRHYVDYRRQPLVTACSMLVKEAESRGILISNVWADVDCDECILEDNAHSGDPLREAEAEIAYWKKQFDKAVEKLDRVKPYSSYEFKGGRKPSPREGREIWAAFEKMRKERQEND